METKFTKGEWKANEFRIGTEDFLICEVYRSRNKGESEANAKLIAAAPDLLEALNKAENLIIKLLSIVKHNNCPYTENEEDQKSFIEIQSAIKKATK